MDTYITYFDESGDDGVTTSSSSYFILSSLYMNTENWLGNFEKMRSCRNKLKLSYGFHTSEEMHTKNLVTDKNPYRNYGWTIEQRRAILLAFASCVADLDAKIINVIIDKTKFIDQNYHVLENALKYNIQRIENDSKGRWNYIIITDRGRIGPMKKTARAIRAYNPIQSKYSTGFQNQPIRSLIEDMLEKDSKESHFIQVCDFISYIVYLYYNTQSKGEAFPKRAGKVVDQTLLDTILSVLKDSNKLNLKASSNDPFGLVIYPK